MKICSLVALKIFLNEDSTDHDIILGQILDDVSARFVATLNRELRQGTYTEYYPTPTKAIYVKAPPITAITSVMFQTAIIDSEYYDTDLENGGIFFDDWVTDLETARGMKVVYTGGYAYATTPETDVLTAAATDLHLVRMANAVKKQAAKEWWRRKELGLATLTMPDGSISALESMPWLPEVLDVISLEKRYQGVFG